jgi:hypothetical protein
MHESAAWEASFVHTSFRVRMRGLVPVIVWVACTAVMPHALHAREGTPAITCRVRDDPRGREFSLRPAGDQKTGAAAPHWQLSMRDAESKTAWIDLRLPGAKPVIHGAKARLAYQNANGGRHVDLDVSPTGSRLEVWVDYGLDVNVEPDLDPHVDRMNTDGPLTAIDCTIQQGAE